MNNAQRVAAFIADHPNCKVTDIELAADTSCIWMWLIEAERMGLITMDNSDGGLWHFHVKERE